MRGRRWPIWILLFTFAGAIDARGEETIVFFRHGRNRPRETVSSPVRD